MTIDEAIAKYKKLANNDRTCYPEEAQQLAEWLEELKDYRDKNKMVVRVDVENMDSIKDEIEKLSKYAKNQYNKAIDDFSTDIINKINFEYKWLFDCKSDNADTDIAFSALITFINELAEQLKAG